ncbi:MAG: transposase, partial [Acidobacteriota bacterium]
RGVGGMEIFADDVDRQAFLSLLSDLVNAGVLIIHCFCLMLTHIHLLAETPWGEMSRCMHRLLGPYAEHYNRRHHRSGHLWQGRYKALLVQDGDYFLEVSRYIHMNPDHNPKTKPVETYPWSSYSNYTAGEGLVNWVETGRLLSYFHSPEDYRVFAESRRTEPLVSPFDSAVAGCLFGDDSFVKRVQEWLKGKAASPDVPARRVLDRWGCSPDIGLIADLVRSTFSGLSENRRNQLLGFVLWKYTWLKGVEIAKIIRRTPGAISQIVRRIELTGSTDSQLASGLETIRLRLEQRREGNRSISVHPDDWLRRERLEPIEHLPGAVTLASRRRRKFSALPLLEN